MKKTLVMLSILLGMTFYSTVDTLVHASVLATVSDGSTVKAEDVFIRIDVEHPVLRLYREGVFIEQFPISLGKRTTATPIGNWQVIDKQKNWGKGFGSRWIGLNVPWGTYGIHGTNRPESIGLYASHGCIRMKNTDVERLYNLVPLGARVVIVGNPLKHLRILEHGNIGADVRIVQQALQKNSFYRGALDGRFGSETQVSLIYFQLAHHLPMDGRVTFDDYKALGLA